MVTLRALVAILFGLVMLAGRGALAADLAELNRVADSLSWSDAMSVSIEIAAPIDEVWKYASDSSLAKEWSSYFDHITPVKGPIPDGQPGAVRMCFRNPTEKGPRWSELILRVEPLKFRRILSFDFVGYRPQALTHSNQTFVEQIYESLGPEKSRMTFRTIPVPGRSFIQTVMLKLARSEAVRLFRVNLENIRAAIEARHQHQPYVRIHAWEPPPASLGERVFTDQEL